MRIEDGGLKIAILADMESSYLAQLENSEVNLT
jgi:hypothetical protein